MEFFTVLSISMLIICGIYCLLIIYFSIGWVQARFPAETFKIIGLKNPFLHPVRMAQITSGDLPSTKISIIIPTRNEEKNICNCLAAISKQNYPKELFEVLVVNDHSEDATTDKVQEMRVSNPTLNLKLLNLEHEIGKKATIAKGIKNASGKLIITTDADCTMGNKWLSSLVAFYEKYYPKMIIAPVCLNSNKTLFSKIQSLEFFSLQGVTGSSAAMGNPIMCNGANFIYEKSAFEEVNGFETIEKTASGDDVLLMLKFKKKFNPAIAFVQSKDAVVYTEPQPNLKSFFQQRKRWVSKSSAYRDFFTIFTSITVFLCCFSIVLSAVLSIFNAAFVEILVLQLVLKSAVDIFFLYLVALFFGKPKLLLLFIIEQVLYVFYVPFIVIAGTTGKTNWKGRAIS
ncbi:MAG: glycosyl transferase [Flavobacteriales bacterium]|nr:MAG: glycosyl transferase [Flavobacteriales bacterium]